MINRGEKVLDLPLREVWRRYDPRIIHAEPLHAGAAGDVDGFGFAGDLPGVAEVVPSGGGVDLRLRDDAEVTTIMSQLASRTALRRLELRRPNLEDIFIQLVGGDAAAIRAGLVDEASPEGVET
jgi:ABC-type uncharacterized transport system ATPase subunit